ncbi:MAG: O-antigen/teichoic acid export membrane protein [Bacteroidia bacterium]
MGILFLRNPVYREGLHIVPFLLLGYLFMGIYYNLSVWFKVTDKTMYGAMITGLGACVTIIANLLLIPILGYLGSAITTLMTYFSMVVLSYFMGQKHYPVPYKVKNALYYIFIVSVLAYAFYYLDMGSLLLNMLFRNISVILFLVIIYLSERKHLKSKVYFGIRLP